MLPYCRSKNKYPRDPHPGCRLQCRDKSADPRCATKQDCQNEATEHKRGPVAEDALPELFADDDRYGNDEGVWKSSTMRPHSLPCDSKPPVEQTCFSQSYLKPKTNGVPANEVTPSRPEFQAKATANPMLGLDGRYKINPEHSLLFGLQATWLGHGIAASPIVETRRSVLSWLGLAWNL